MTEHSPRADLSLLVEFAEARAYADLLRAAPTRWGFRADESDAGTMLVAPTFDIPLFNRAIGLGLLAPATEEWLNSIIGTYRSAGVRNFAIQLSPSAKPRQIPGWLQVCDLVARDNWAKVYRSDEPVSMGRILLRIDRIGREHAEIFAVIACAAFRMPNAMQSWLASTVGRSGWHHYIAWDGTVAIACGALFVSGNVGWLGIAGTLPDHRRRGAQGVLMERRIHDGRELGCKWFVTETGEDLPERPNPSFHNMMRMGFTLAYQRPNYMSPAKKG